MVYPSLVSAFQYSSSTCTSSFMCSSREAWQDRSGSNTVLSSPLRHKHHILSSLPKPCLWWTESLSLSTSCVFIQALWPCNTAQFKEQIKFLSELSGCHWTPVCADRWGTINLSLQGQWIQLDTWCFRLKNSLNVKRETDRKENVSPLTVWYHS